MTVKNEIPRPASIFYVMSFIYPIAGILLGAIFYGQDGLRSFGVNCLKAAIISQSVAIGSSLLVTGIGIALVIFGIVLKTGIVPGA